MTRERALALRAMIEKAAASLDDADALKAVELYEPWKIGVMYTVDSKRYRFRNDLYRCKQEHTSQADWTPDVAVSLWEKVPEPGQGDTPDNPIPYSGNMALVMSKYYSQDGVVYLCIRDTVNPVYAALRDLVGLYVEVVQ